MTLETNEKNFKEFDEQYNKWYSKFEERDGFKEGALVRYIGINDKNDGCITHRQYCGFPSDPRAMLTLDRIYEVEYRILARSWQLVKLVGFPYEVEFSPSIFEIVGYNTESTSLKKGALVRFIGLEDDFLTSGETYQVEGLLLHYHGYGYVSIKLVGFDTIYDRRLFERIKN